MPQTILVLGATSIVSSQLIKQLAGVPDVTVRAAVRSPSAVDYSSYPNVTAVAFDFEEPSSFDDALSGVDRVFLKTPFAPHQEGYAKVLIHCASVMGVKHIVSLGSLQDPMVQGQPLSVQQAVDAFLEASGVPYTHLRTTPFMENFLTAHAPDVDGNLALPIGGEAVSWISAQDVASVAAAVLTSDGHAGKTYDLTGPAALTSADVARILGEANQRSITCIQASSPEMQSLMIGRGMTLWMVRGVMGLYGAFGPSADDQPVGTMLDAFTLYSTLGAQSDAVETIMGTPPRSFAQFVGENALAPA